jgi:hypothetical protein
LNFSFGKLLRSVHPRCTFESLPAVDLIAVMAELRKAGVEQTENLEPCE